jgi:Uma2 family endonuclease
MTATLAQISRSEYLRQEHRAEYRSEWIDGRVERVPGASKIHACIVFNLTLALGIAVRQRGFRLSQGDTLLYTPNKRYYYPDLMVCPFDSQDTHLEDAPCLLVEVLSPTTAAKDRGPKLDEYLKIPTLRQYLLIEQHQASVKVFERSEDGWHLRVFDGEGTFEVVCLGVALSLSDIYHSVHFEEAEVEG